MVLKNHPLSGEERKIVSTRIYASEFVRFKKLCNGVAINTKLRQMIQAEIERDIKKNGDLLLIKGKEGIERRSAFPSIKQASRSSQINLEKFKRAL